MKRHRRSIRPKNNKNERMKINCLVIDDEPYAVNLLEEYISQVPWLHLLHKCYNALEALDYLKKERPDLIFMDINMPHLSGMQLATLLPSDQPFIFTTAYAEFAVDSYEKNAIDYLLKPITFERFLKAVTKASRLQTAGQGDQLAKSPATQKLFLKTGKAIVQLDYEDVLLIEGLKDYVVFHTAAAKHVVYKRMKELDNHVFIGTERIPVSEKYREVFLSRINKGLL
jgi:DNA-binding LytR/AlgR family response regulator